MSQETCTLATQLARGMGSFFKNCECSRQSRCPHPYATRYRDATGRQCVETGYANQTAALDRLNKVYDQKRNIPRQKADIKRQVGKHFPSWNPAG